MTDDPINPEVRTRVENLGSQFQSARPFRHVVVDGFLKAEVADALLAQFPSVSDPSKLLNEFGVPNPKSQISDVVRWDRYLKNWISIFRRNPF
jgi:hypothetical protein